MCKIKKQLFNSLKYLIEQITTTCLYTHIKNTIYTHEHDGTIKHYYLQSQGLSAAKFMIKVIYYKY